MLFTSWNLGYKLIMMKIGNLTHSVFCKIPLKDLKKLGIQSRKLHLDLMIFDEKNINYAIFHIFIKQYLVVFIA